jgi:hypothetical protein
VAAATRSVALAAALCLAPACHKQKLPPRPDGAAVVVVTGGEAELPAVPEVEPNDQPAKAQPLLVAAAAVAVTGTLGAAGSGRPDVDLFRVDVPRPDAAAPPPAADAGVADAGAPRPTQILRAELRPDSALAARLEVLDAAGHPLIAAPAGEPGQTLVIPNLALGASPPILRVRRGHPDTGPGSYRLILRTAALEAGAEIEPNGSAAQANPLAPDGEAIGFLGWARDQDWYRLATSTLADGSVLAVDVEAPPGVAVGVTLYDAAGAKLSEGRGGRGERAVLRNVGVPAGAAALLLSVTAASGWNGDATYALRLRADLPKAGGETEPNDTPAQAQAIGDGTVQGFLARGDVDLFGYTAAGPVALDVELVPPERAAVKVELLDASGKSLGRAEGRRREVKLSGVRVAAGLVLVRITGKGEGNPDDPYKLTVTSRPIPMPGSEPDAGAGGE